MITIKQGTDFFFDANGLKDAAGNQLDVSTGYTLRAVARAGHVRGQLVADWSTSPAGSQGSVIMGGSVVDRVRLVGTPSQTTPWTCAIVVIQAELTNPTGQVARIIDETCAVSPEAVTD